MSKCRFLVAIVCAVLSSGPAAANDSEVYIQAGTLVDVLEGRALKDQLIVVDGDRISSVGPAADQQIPAGAEVIDLSEYTVLPGLIDMHDHLTGDHRFHGYRSLGISVPRATLYGVLNARKTLQAGFTTVRNVGAEGYSDVALRDAINDGEIDGPRLRVSGPALGITGGHCDNNLLPPNYHDRAEGVADGPWAVRAKVRETIKYGADLIKFCATGGVLSKGDSVGGKQYTFDEMSTAARSRRMRTAPKASARRSWRVSTPSNTPA
jgi:imidazolonepropionase-like amidohydrolase